jgi:NitT/TauT family transport system substrate-binding protein
MRETPATATRGPAVTGRGRRLGRWLARRGRLGLAAIPAAAALLAAGCQVPGTAAPSAAVTRPFTIAVVPSLATAPLRLATADGMFARHGLDVRVQTYQTVRQAYAALASGQADVIGGDYADLLYAQQQRHAQLRLIADGYDAVPGLLEMLTLPGSPVTSPQALEGAAVATPPADLVPFSAVAPYNTETLAAEAVLQSDGVSPSGIHWEPMPSGSMIAALRHHTVAAIVATQPYILQAESELGAVELLDVCSGVTASLPLSGYFATAGTARRDAAMLRGFRAALSAATAVADQPGTARSVLRALPGMSAQEADLVTVGQYPGFLSVGQVQRVADLMYGTGMVASTIPVREQIFR